MDFNPTTCADCPAKVLCQCLQVTEAVVVEAIQSLDLRNLRDVRRHTGAGEGCTCCHERLRQVLEQARTAAVSCG